MFVVSKCGECGLLDKLSETSLACFVHSELPSYVCNTTSVYLNHHVYGYKCVGIYMYRVLAKQKAGGNESWLLWGLGASPQTI